MRWISVSLVAVLVAVAGCDGASPPPLDAHAAATSDHVVLSGRLGLTFPQQVGAFHREDVLRRGPSGQDVTVGYDLENAESPLIATVRVHPSSASGSLIASLDRSNIFDQSTVADAQSSDRELKASIAQIRHFYPNATVRDERPAYLVKNGAIQTGVVATVQYQYPLGGKLQTVDLDVETFCCVGRGWTYEYRFRYAPDQKIGAEVVPFMKALSWQDRAP